MRTMKEFLTKLTDGTYIPGDKMLHFTAQFMVLTIIVSLFDFNFWNLQVLNVVMAVGKELFDKFVKQSYIDIGDAIAGILGGILAILMVAQW